MNLSLRLWGLLALSAVIVVVLLWRGTSSEFAGEVSVDGTAVPVGTVSLIPLENNVPPRSFTILEGRFVIPEEIPLTAGSYRAEVLVGNALGMPIPQLQDHPLSSLNGARFQREFTVDATGSHDMNLQFQASQARTAQSGSGLAAER